MSDNPAPHRSSNPVAGTQGVGGTGDSEQQRNLPDGLTQLQSTSSLPQAGKSFHQPSHNDTDNNHDERGGEQSVPPTSAADTDAGGAAVIDVIDDRGGQYRSGTILKSRATRFSHRSSFGHIHSAENPWEVPFPCPQSSIRKGSNYIRTTKYTVLTFIPLNLYYQFRQFYNLYFLFAALTTFFSSSLSWYTQVVPLLIVLAFAAVKDIIEDYARYVSDRDANNAPAKVMRNGVKVEVLAQDIQPGDLIYVAKGEKFPVDAILLSTNYDDGTCFIETAELDGETNLKRRTALDHLCHTTTVEGVAKLSGLIQCEKPNENLTTYEGRLNVALESNSETKVFSLSLQNLLLRGAVLRNTDFCWGVVVYTGANTKIIRNLKRAGLKSSRLQMRLNHLVLFCFVFNAILLFGSTLFEWFHYKNLQSQETNNTGLFPKNFPVEWYLVDYNTDSLTTNYFYTFLSYFSAYTYVIPISLFVTMELVRLGQGRFMMWDKKMTLMRKPGPFAPADTPVEKITMKANNTNLNEELGAIEYIFSDKTGTLTQNEMRLARWFVDGVTLDEMADPGGYGRKLKDPDTPPQLLEKMTLFARSIALCHGVIPAVDEKTGVMVYESQSPDETALLFAMAANDVKLTFRSKQQMKIDNLGIMETYEILKVLEFSSDRKRMSVIVRTPQGLHLYCKGADNIIFARLSKASEFNPGDILEKAESAVQKFSEFGLRTLVIAYAPLTEEAYQAFSAEYEEAEKSLVSRDAKVAAACEKVEKNLRLLGCTAIEDRLQDEVPETIEYILKCDIRLWLLTGDKQETAINIGMSSRLIAPDMAIMILNAKSEAETVTALDTMVASMSQRADGRRNALIINGETLEFIFSTKQESKLLHIGVNCHSVICCRVTPLQKALVVKLVKVNLKKATLAIGDGANDVSMIQAADVGVGIMGREGTQAVRSSDFAFGEFRFLKRLLSVHGRFSYLRLSQLVFYSFYKNLTFITVQWWFGFYSLWSQTLVYDEIFFTAFNVVFTSLPPFVYALIERDIDEPQIDIHPELYKQAKGGLYWNWTHKVAVLLSSIWHSLVVFYVVYFAFGDGVISPTGRPVGYWVQCFLLSTPMLTILMLKMALLQRHWVWLSFAGIAISLFLNVAIEICSEYIQLSSSIGTFIEQYSLLQFYLQMLLIPVMALLPDFAVMYYKRQYNPSDADILSEESAVRRRQRKADRRAGRKKRIADGDIQLTEVNSGA